MRKGPLKLIVERVETEGECEGCALENGDPVCNGMPGYSCVDADKNYIWVIHEYRDAEGSDPGGDVG